MKPSKTDADAIDELIRRLGGDRGASLSRLLPLVYDELRALAARQLAAQRPDHTLQPTALINEAYLRLAGQDYESWEDRRQFILVAATVMRRVLVDHARRRRADKRPPQEMRVEFETDQARDETAGGSELIALDELLEKLFEIDPRQGRIVELRYFAGLSMEETARALDISRATVAREWRMARAWLERQLRDDGPSE